MSIYWVYIYIYIYIYISHLVKGAKEKVDNPVDEPKPSCWDVSKVCELSIVCYNILTLMKTRSALWSTSLISWMHLCWKVLKSSYSIFHRFKVPLWSNFWYSTFLHICKEHDVFTYLPKFQVVTSMESYLFRRFLYKIIRPPLMKHVPEVTSKTRS